MTRSPFASELCLAAENLTVLRGGRAVLSGVSLSVTGGQALIVTGPNGAGKSTLLRTLAGLLAPTSGQMRLSGSTEPELPGLSSHYIGHADAMKATLTAAENLEFWATMLGLGAAGSTAAEALSAFGLAHVLHLPVAYLSAGQKRRVALARLLVARRPVWLLDEPTTALDAASQVRLSELMQAHLGEGGIIIAATHGPLGLTDPRRLELGTSA